VDAMAEFISAFDALTANVDDWQYQAVQEGEFNFHRVWRNWGEGRVHAHVLPPSKNEKPYWHAHHQPVAVAVLGPGYYELALGGTNGQPVATISASFPTFYTMRPGAWHLVRVLDARPCCTLYITGQYAESDGVIGRAQLLRVSPQKLSTFVDQVRDVSDVG